MNYQKLLELKKTLLEIVGYTQDEANEAILKEVKEMLDNGSEPILEIGVVSLKMQLMEYVGYTQDEANEAILKEVKRIL